MGLEEMAKFTMRCIQKTNAKLGLGFWDRYGGGGGGGDVKKNNVG